MYEFRRVSGGAVVIAVVVAVFFAVVESTALAHSQPVRNSYLTDTATDTADITPSDDVDGRTEGRGRVTGPYRVAARGEVWSHSNPSAIEAVTPRHDIGKIVGWTLFRPSAGPRVLSGVSITAANLTFDKRLIDFVGFVELGGASDGFGAAVFLHGGHRSEAHDGNIGFGDLWTGFKFGLHNFPLEATGNPGIIPPALGLMVVNSFGFSTGQRVSVADPPFSVPAVFDLANHLMVKDFTYDLAFVMTAPFFGDDNLMAADVHFQFPFGYTIEFNFHVGFELTRVLTHDAVVRVGVHISTAFMPVMPYFEFAVGPGGWLLSVRAQLPAGKGANPAPSNEFNFLVTFMMTE